MPQPARLMDGTTLAKDIVARAAERAAIVKQRIGRAPCLATVLVGDDPASATYVRMKRNRCASAGIDSRHVHLPATISTQSLVETITALSEDPEIDGILLQHPVGPHIDERAAFEAITPAKDVDGVTLASFAAMSFALPGFASCTPAGILRLLDAYAVDLPGKHAVIVGRSPILGKPIGMLLLSRDTTVTYCHSHTKDLKAITRQADILVAAAGRPHLLTGDHVKQDAIVIDAGYNPGPTGDVHFPSAAPRASLITPVPGGVGPMTLALLLDQTVTAATRQHP